ncbi:hypothetical protein [Halalkalibacter sp. APA_J-10(15)]|uniref:hypothetical protein n=1 Tax=Halalkalibacter sp. APA_J-10(15) TaxID=2933805 RepID=UPI001FF1C27F|nr:hypothetical protein [Halalkalibacter sp. APA_J-10(15)]MCK0473229.1 hypothetical protein [Halalkalibacter sp. APA_J-10(15)]
MGDFMRKYLVIGAVIILAACGSKAELSDYVEVYFDGYDTFGTATYEIDEDRLVNDTFELSKELFDIDLKTLNEIDNMLTAYSIELVHVNDLSNGDEVVVKLMVDENKTKKLTTKDELKVTVSGLDEPKQLSDEEIEKNVVVNFNGVSGKGSLMIDTTFIDDLSKLTFESSQDGEIKNGDTVVVGLTEDAKDSLPSLGYVLTGEGAVQFQASGLEEVAESPSDIANLEDIERLISEGINREYQDSPWGFYKYEIIKESTYYRQFKRDEDSNSIWGNSPSNGTLVSVYTIKSYGSDEKLERTFTAIYGFTDIILDENNKANVAEINEYSDSYDDTYSLESVEKLLEGYGYQLISK